MTVVIDLSRFRDVVEADGADYRRRPLSANMIADVFENMLSFQAVGANMVPSLLERFREVLDVQSHMRGLPRPPKSLYAFSLDTDLGYSSIVAQDPDWFSSVDRHLHNRKCSRCGGLVTVGFEHTMDECDLILAGDVLGR